METNAAPTLSAVSLFAVTCAAQHVDLTKFARIQRMEGGFTAEQCDEWLDCWANPEMGWGLRDSLEMAHGLDNLREFAAVYRQTVKALATQAHVPCLG
jgi:hypothetical protein